MAGLNITADELRRLLVERLQLLDEASFDNTRAIAGRLQVPLENALAERGRIPFPFMLEQIAQAWGVGFIDVRVADVNPEALLTVSEEYARRHTLIPFQRADRKLAVAMWDPRNRTVVDEIGRLTKLEVVPHLASEMAIRRAHLLYKRPLREMLEQAGSGGTAGIRPPTLVTTEGSAVELLNRVLEFAAAARASDIHIEPYELEALVRCRIDGVLQEVLTMPPPILLPLVARIKILSSMRIDERRAPQDGRFEADLGGLKLDLRVSSLPTHWGEKIVMRVLNKESIVFDLEDLGLSPADYPTVLRNITRPMGMILVTGPTGSGKTTSLYAMLTRMGAERQNVVNISTIEDPIEYTISRVNQMPLNAAAGVDFATGLRALLRQDPDIIMVGEIRDRQTAEIAIRAALVGRLLLSTLHTNDATGAVPRLLDMGIEPFLLATTISMVVAQRLVRRNCVSCRESVEPDASALQALSRRDDFDETLRILQDQGVLRRGEDPLAGLRFFRAKGCRQCSGTGFRGRLGVFEIFEIDDEMRAMIMDRRDGNAIRTVARRKGMKTMFQDGLGKVLLGETTLEEVLRVAL